jgi:hypothetical protein
MHWQQTVLLDAPPHLNRLTLRHPASTPAWSCDQTILKQLTRRPCSISVISHIEAAITAELVSCCDSHFIGPLCQIRIFYVAKRLSGWVIEGHLRRGEALETRDRD